MMPYFFGDSDSHLFGSYHPPTTASTTHSGVLICYPIGHEYIRTHRLLLQIARMLSRMGLHVFRFDYFGTGDSAGDIGDARISRWVDDTHAAIDEFRAVASIHSISILGMRFGANIASMASETDGTIKTLLLCDPIFQPRDYLASVSKLHTRMLEDPDRFNRSRRHSHNSEHDLLGFEFTLPLRQSMENLNVTFDIPTVSNINFVLSKETRLCVNSVPRSNTYTISLDCKWNSLEFIETALVAPEFVQQIKTIMVAG